ncbi:hypothetical protein Daudx_1706 [Candidatus Desulforudis audaxviator]|nr:hypothetical protein Daudx_1706 [Candidatus Desulforudis audaxviator]
MLGFRPDTPIREGLARFVARLTAQRLFDAQRLGFILVIVERLP